MLIASTCLPVRWCRPKLMKLLLPGVRVGKWVLIICTSKQQFRAHGKDTRGCHSQGFIIPLGDFNSHMGSGSLNWMVDWGTTWSDLNLSGFQSLDFCASYLLHAQSLINREFSKCCTVKKRHKMIYLYLSIYQSMVLPLIVCLLGHWNHGSSSR